MTPVEVRSLLVDALKTDLVGPPNDSKLASEILAQNPSRWYLTGFLVPLDADESQKTDETAQEGTDEVSDSGGSDDAATPEAPAARRTHFPSSMGMSVLVAAETSSLEVIAHWGDYKREGDLWKRSSHEESLSVAIPTDGKPKEFKVPKSAGLEIVVSARTVPTEAIKAGLLPKGSRAVSIFLVNSRRPCPDEVRDEGFAFQTELEVKSEVPLVPRPNLRGLQTDDLDERIADLQYRDAYEYAVGHNVSTHAAPDTEGHCNAVRTCWIPRAEVERVAPAEIKDVELGMEALADLKDGAEAQKKLGEMVVQYRSWIDSQKAQAPKTPKPRAETAEELFKKAKIAAARIEAGIKLLDDPMILEAFRIANRTMAAAARRRMGPILDPNKKPEDVDAPAWRPFQLAFILMNLRGLAEPKHADRDVVDLLFFPTGGGKTEAYLGLAAFVLVLRRMRNPGISSAGLSVLMRYTLRLLTLDQLSRASTLICALELERQKDVDKLGEWPFEIGLWVGQAATPNRMGKKGENDPYSARAKTIAFLNDDRKPSPIPLENCPWCGKKFSRNSFQLAPNPDNPIDLRVRCVNRNCDFSSKRPLPIVGVDEPIYRRLPCFMIATVDKFAAMPWTGEVGMFFGKAERYDKDGFYGPCDAGKGNPLKKPLLPPDLVIQDELHLISGPLGTMVGLYESALDQLCSRRDGDKVVRPKIVASTATVRRAEKQVRALFNRVEMDVFPPPGHDRRHSFFAQTHTAQESNPRSYIGIAAQGRSPKVILLRTYLALLGAAQKMYLAEGGDKSATNPADPYMTLVGYFNSLRELGGSRRIVEDEVGTRLSGYSKRKRVGETEGLFADRKIAYEVVELTSRVSTNKVAEAKRRLALAFMEKDRVDVALATNMISVGLDIVRLGLMVVFGQPKTTAEYIQATSRVGRDVEKPGLVVTLINIHKPRDRSHYERFGAYHQSFYRSVEATSVTPFSPRALDRGLAGTAVALARHGHTPMTPYKGAMQILQERGRLDFVADNLSQRGASHAIMPSSAQQALQQTVSERTKDLLDEWAYIANDLQGNGTQLQYQSETGAAQRLLYEFLNPDLKRLHSRHKKFRANRSLRDVESSVNLWLKTLDNVEIEPEVEE